MDGKNRYMIGDKECFVTFDQVEHGTCLIQIGNKFFRISILLLKTIATPAP